MTPFRSHLSGALRVCLLGAAIWAARPELPLAQSASATTGDLQTQQSRPSGDAEQPTELDEIVVIGSRPTIAVVENFIAQVSAPVRSRGLARWTRPVCVGAINLHTDAAQRLVDGVSTIAREIGLGAGEPGCQENILIVGADDGAAMADAMVDSNPSLFRPGSLRMVQPRSALRAFTTSSAPVRWWTVSAPVDSVTGKIIVRLPGQPPPAFELRTFSGRRAQIRDDLQQIFIVVDMQAASGVSFEQLSGYLAVVALSQVDAEADTPGFDTVLNLFSADTDTPQGLTDWDRAYLSSLYAARNERILPHRQAEAMMQTLTARRAAEDEAD